MTTRTVLRLGASLAFVLAGLAAECAASEAFAKQAVRIEAAPLQMRAATPADLKMDAGLRMVVERARESVDHGLPPHRSPRFAALLRPSSPFSLRFDMESMDPEIPVFLRLDRGAVVEPIVARGARVMVQRGDLVIAGIPLSRVEAVAETPEVRALSVSRRWSAVLDSSRARLGVKDVHDGAVGLPQAYRGSGVIVGVLDSGLDYTHADFRTTDDKTRLKGLFDYSQGTDGAECRVGQLDSLTCPEIDGSGAFGHGTHVTGIAAGNARRNPIYMGMAPEADLLFVKGMRDPQSNGPFDDIDVVNGTIWMMNKALALGQPIVVNLSLGGQLGAHDGTSNQEQFLDILSGPGRIIVAAAGNSGNDPIHVSYNVQGTDYFDALESGLILLGGPSAFVDLWAPAGSNIGVGIAAYADLNTLGSPIYTSPVVPAGQVGQGPARSSGGTLLANIRIDALTTVDANNGQRNVQISIEPAPGGIDPSQVVWSIYTVGSGTFDMWSLAGSVFLPVSIPQPSYFRPGDRSKTVGMPGTARRILCVGSHVTRTQWVDADGILQTQPNATLDALSGFSSRGPSRDGRTLPNFTAAGEAILSALSKDFTAGNNVIALGGGYQKQQGTSQAAPHVTGIVALMLQRDPALTPENARAILQQSAAPAGGTVPNNDFGSGKVRALAALQLTPDPLDCMTTLPSGLKVRCETVAGQPFALMAYPTPAAGSLRLRFTAPTRGRVHLALYDLLGRRVRTLIDGVVEAGDLTSVWDGVDEGGRTMPSGVYFAKLVTPAASRSIRFVLAR